MHLACELHPFYILQCRPTFHKNLWLACNLNMCISQFNFISPSLTLPIIFHQNWSPELVNIHLQIMTHAACTCIANERLARPFRLDAATVWAAPSHLSCTSAIAPMREAVSSTETSSQRPHRDGCFSGLAAGIFKGRANCLTFGHNAIRHCSRN